MRNEPAILLHTLIAGFAMSRLLSYGSTARDGSVSSSERIHSRDTARRVPAVDSMENARQVPTGMACLTLERLRPPSDSLPTRRFRISLPDLWRG